jgi:hypothetical protein
VHVPHILKISSKIGEKAPPNFAESRNLVGGWVNEVLFDRITDENRSAADSVLESLRQEEVRRKLGS